MKKVSSKILFPVVLFLIFPAFSFAQVSQIVFTTDSQSIKPNELSEPITIQTQDSSGNSFQTPETMDVQFISTSATGEFLGSTGNPATTYMSKNTANKTFYYKDSSEGIFTITINVRGRETGIELDTSQQITISSGASQNNNQNSPGEVLGVSDNSSLTSSSSSGGGNTTHASSLNSQLEIIAGNDRISSPGSPIWFQAILKKNSTGVSPELNWSFGDGNVGVGPLVNHEYKYPGDYVVILSSRAGDIFSVSRLKVKVIDSNISVTDKGEYLEISNNGDVEVNLFNWKVENDGKGFIFQPNTIILPHSSIKLDKNILTMHGFDNSLGTSLKNSLKEEVFAIAPVKEANLIEIAKNIESIKKEALVIQEKAKNLGFTPQNKNINIKPTDIAAVAFTDSIQATTSVSNVIYEVPKKDGFISKLTNFIKRVFSK